MKKCWFLVGIMFFSLLLTAGCDIPQEEYNVVVLQLSKAEEELKTVEGQLKVAQAENLQLTLNLEKSKSELEAAKAENSKLTLSLERSQKRFDSELGSVKSELAGIKTEKQALEETNAKLKRFNFFKTALCSKKPEPWEPEPQADNIFKTNETVYVYAEIIGWKYVPAGQKLQVDIKKSVKILDTEGKEVGSNVSTDTVTHELPAGRYGFSRAFGPLKAGKYTVEIEIADNNSGETITWKEKFEVIDTDSGEALTFKEEAGPGYR